MWGTWFAILNHVVGHILKVHFTYIGHQKGNFTTKEGGTQTMLEQKCCHRHLWFLADFSSKPSWVGVWLLNFCAAWSPDAGFMSENPESGLPTGKATDADTPVSAPPCLRVSLMLGMKNLASGNPTCYSGNLRPIPLFQYTVGFTRGVDS